MKYDSARATELLRLGTKDARARFRNGQEDAIRHIVEGRGRLLVVQRTGWGKSFVYFIATKLLREGGAGPTLLISPLLALMRNQVAAATLMGVRAGQINSSNTDDWDDVEESLRRDDLDVLLVSPERFANARFNERALRPIASRIALLVVDEGHCISDWGHDFRPQYRQIGRLIRGLPPNLRLLVTTATANNRVMEDLQELLGPKLEVMRGALHRPSLRLQTISLPTQAERMAWLAQHVPQLPGSGIIYTLTIRDAEMVALWLRSKELKVEAYTGETGPARVELERALLENRIKALVATSALGMGFDKPDLGFVIHYQAPGSVVSYYQQVGRAGRALDQAFGVLLAGSEDLEISNFFIREAFPAREEVDGLLRELEAEEEGLQLSELLSRLNFKRQRILKALELLELESPAPLVRDGSRWRRTAAPVSAEFWARVERLTRLRREEQQQMQEYVDLDQGHMAFLIRALDGEPSDDAMGQTGTLPASVDPLLVAEATHFLQRAGIEIQPRKIWPTGGLQEAGLRGMIPEDRRAQTGRALSRWADAGWGSKVKSGKYEHRRFADELVVASASLIREWKPAPSPTWVTCVPSRRHPDLVPDFARRLAIELGLPFHESLVKPVERPEQKLMANSAQQARNVATAFEVSLTPIPNGPVLLVDDVVDSKWTITVCSVLLRSHGSGEVWPFVLSAAGSGQ